jgi:peptidoglycan/LPS O-acetylase OafA/YrhL
MKEYFGYLNGLRGISILLVVTYHITDHKLFKNGFLGVDIFFVISGFILTYKYLDNINLKTYFLNRVKRIIPTLLLTLIFSILIMNFYIKDSYIFNENIKLIRNTLFFVNNLYLLKNIDYFNPEVSNFLTYHLWSLSIEEQFYLIFPFVMLFKNNHKVIIFISILFFIIFFFSSIVIVDRGLGLDDLFFVKSQNFFNPLVRFIEILIGCISAIIVKNKFRINSLMSYFILAVIVSIYFFGNFANENHPGFITILFSLLLSSFIISLHSNKNNYLNYFLNLKFFQIFGYISYTLYLLHIPILFLIFHYFKNENLLINIFSFSLVSIISFFVWKFYELPIYKNNLNKKKIFTIIAVYMILFFISFQEKKDMSISSDYKFAGTIDDKMTYNNCFFTNENFGKISNKCFEIDKSKKNIIFWGDSLASSLAIVFKKTYKEYNVLTFTGSSCTPRIHNSDYNDFDGTHCKIVNELATNFISKNNDLKVIVHSRNRFTKFNPSLDQKNNFIVLGITPRWKGDMLAFEKLDNTKKTQTSNLGLVSDIFKYDMEYIEYFEKFKNAKYISMLNYLCHVEQETVSNKCITLIKYKNEIIPYTYDHIHISYFMAKYIYESFLKELIIKE